MAFFHRNRTNIPKFVWNHKWPQIAKVIFRKKNKASNIMLLYFKLYYKTRVIKSMILARKYRLIKQNENLETNPHRYGLLISDKEAKTIQWKKNNLINKSVQFSSVQFSRSVVSDSLRPHESQHSRPPCPSLTPRVYTNSCPSSWWCHPAISSSVIPFSSCPQSLLASGSFPMSQPFTWGGQSIGVSASASVLPMNTQDWSPLGWTGWLSLQSKGLSIVFSNTMNQKNQFFCAQLSSQ